MKKYFICFMIFIIIIFIIPAICTKSLKQKENIKIENKIEQDIQKENKENNYNYSKYGKIKLYHTKTKQIEELPIDEYLYGTVSAEMPVSYELEALKAQAIVSRTYTLYQTINSHKHGKADVCDDYKCCQAWISKEDRLSKWKKSVRKNNWAKIINAVNSTKGIIITYKGKPIDAFFHSNSGGKTESALNVWGGSNYPYLQSVETSGEDGYSEYNSEVKLTKDKLMKKIKEKHPDIKINFNKKDEIKILDFTESGRVKTIKFGNVKMAGTEARIILGLKSTSFTVTFDKDNIIFKVTGYGHGVGMSQTGANTLAKSGNSAENIIKHFYTGVKISFVNDL